VSAARDPVVGRHRGQRGQDEVALQDDARARLDVAADHGLEGNRHHGRVRARVREHAGVVEAEHLFGA
jgi:hypothetical protein